MMYLRIAKFILLAGMALGISSSATAREYYVDPAGSDIQRGSIDFPFKTLVRALKAAKPGDTVYLKEGIYRQDHTIGQWYFDTDTSEQARITVKSYPGQRAVITSMKLLDNPGYWKLVDGYEHVYAADLDRQETKLGRPKPARVSNCSQDGLPLRLMTDYNSNGGPSDLNGPGQWVRDVRSWKLYVWSVDGHNPGNRKTELSHFTHGGSNTISIRRNFSPGRAQNHYITFEDLTIEGGYYPIEIETNHIQIRNCAIRNCYSDAVKIGGAKPRDPNNPDGPQNAAYYNSTHGLIENCDMSNFGEQGIDLTGGDYWIIRNNRIHHNADNRGDMPGNTKASGIVIKNNSIGSLVEGNEIHDLNTAFGAIAIGGNSFGGIAAEAVGAVVRNNTITRICGPYAVLFAAAINCSFYGNTVSDCDLTSAVVQMRRSNGESPATNNKNCTIVYNVFQNNRVSFGRFGQYHFAYREYHEGCMQGMVSDYNVIDPSLTYYFGSNKSLGEFRSEGFEIHSIVNSDQRE